MKKKLYQLYVSIAVCLCVAIFMFLSISIINNEKMVDGYIRDQLSNSAGMYANEFDNLLQRHEDAVAAAAVFVEMAFQNDESMDNEMIFVEKWNELDMALAKILEKNEDMLTVYFTLSFDKTAVFHSIFYQRGPENDIYPVSFEGEEIASVTIEEVLRARGDDYFNYYYNALRDGSAWEDPFADPDVTETKVATFAKAVYNKGGELIGVAGGDMAIEKITEAVRQMEMHNDNMAMLFDKGGNLLATNVALDHESEDIILGSIGAYFAQGALSRTEDRGSLDYDYNGRPYMGAFSELNNEWILQIALPTDVAKAPLAALKELLILLGLLLLVTAVVLVVYLSKWSLRPIIKELGEKDILIAHQSRQAKMGEMLGNVAHQWKQPLNTISIVMANLGDDVKLKTLDEEQFNKYQESIQLSIDTMSETLEDFMDYLKPDKEKKLFCVNREVELALRLVDESIKTNRIRIIKTGEMSLWSYGNPHGFAQAVFNLITNARDAVWKTEAEEKWIRIEYARMQGAKGGKRQIVVSIYNNGAPIPPKELEMLFTPYFTTKEESGGTGIGLYISKQIIEEQMEGKLEVFNCEEGVCSRITIPAAETPAGEEEQPGNGQLS